MLKKIIPIVAIVAIITLGVFIFSQKEIDEVAVETISADEVVIVEPITPEAIEYEAEKETKEEPEPIVEKKEVVPQPLKEPVVVAPNPTPLPPTPPTPEPVIPPVPATVEEEPKPEIIEEPKQAEEPSCGSSHRNDTEQEPTTLCEVGTASSVSLSNNEYHWSCISVNEETSCKADHIVHGTCGVSSGTILESHEYRDESIVCESGTHVALSKNNGEATWQCRGVNTGRNAQCSAYVKENGVCGSSSGKEHTSSPSSGLCSIGTSSSVQSTSEGFNWSCEGLYGGRTSSCSTRKKVSVPVSSEGGTTNTGGATTIPGCVPSGFNTCFNAGA